MKLTRIAIIIGLTVSSSVFAANTNQAAMAALQKQVASISSEMRAALAAQQASNQKAISDLQTQVQSQLTHMQTEIQQLQTQLSSEIKQVQTEAAKTGSAPVETAVPGPVKLAPSAETLEKK